MLFYSILPTIIAFFTATVENTMCIKIKRTKRKQLFRGTTNWIKICVIQSANNLRFRKCLIRVNDHGYRMRYFF